MRKMKCFFNLSKEEAWLNRMAASGWHLVGHNGFSHEFAPGEPATANHRIDYRIFKSPATYEEYLALFADTGWRHVGGTRSTGTQYFVAASAEAGSDIFSDDASRIGRTRRMLQGWAAAMLPVWVALFVTNPGAFDLYTLLHPKELYFTPGLWERTGFEFWFGFLFETPFALLRGYAWAIPFLMLLVAAIFYIRLLVLSRRQANTQL